jgi:hypothetical protein
VGEWARGSLRHWQSQLKSDKDYHGNFTAQLFERWFKELCQSLANDHGSCVIHLDGAKYHKRLLNPNPTASWKKASIQCWLTYVYFWQNMAYRMDLV